MSYAVVENGALLHISEDAAPAVKIFESKPDSKMVRVMNLEELQIELDASVKVKPCATDEVEVDDEFSNVLRQLLDKLDESGINAENAEELRKKIQSGGEQLVAEVRSLGIRSMRVVGDGLSTLGEFMRSISESDSVQSQSTDDDGNDEHKHKPE